MFKALLDDAFPLIEKSAPFLATMLGAPGMGVPAFIAMSALGKALGIDNKSSSFFDDIKNIIKTNPDIHEKLNTLESALVQGNAPLKISNAELNLHVQWVDGSLKLST